MARAWAEALAASGAEARHAESDLAYRRNHRSSAKALRPPYGIFNASALALARAHRWELLLWSKDGRDWQRRATADSIAAHATQGLRGGDVILLHDADHYSAPGSWRQTIAAIPRIVETIDHQRPHA